MRTYTNLNSNNNGKFYADAAATTTASTTAAVAMIAYVGSETGISVFKYGPAIGQFTLTP